MSAEQILRDRLALLSLERKVRLLTGDSFWSLYPEPAVGLRRVVLSDGPAGVRGELWDERDPSANVPSPTALAASWDEARVERLGRLLAAEARRKGVDVFLAPTVNLHRSPYGGRHFECFSEDPLLTARIGAAYVKGVQSGGVAATVKHFVANDSETERFSVDARVDERALRELYLAPFEHIVGVGGAWAVMAAYNTVNGTTMTEHAMLNELLKGEWGFDGLVMSDWYATRSTDAAGNGGMDLAMPGPGGPWGDALVAAVRAGTVTEAAIDEKVLRLLRLAARVGALDGIAPAAPAPAAWSDDEITAELRGAAAAGFVLARNVGGVLPLDRTALGRVAVLGPNAAQARTLGGGSATVFPPYTVSPLDGLRAALGADVEVVHSPGVRSTDRVPPASLDLLRHPDGTPGLEVRLLGPDGAELGREHRTGAALTWLGSFGSGLPVAAVAALEVRTAIRAPVAGRYLIGVSGLGPFRLTLGERVAIDDTVELPPGADPVEGMMRPPQRVVPVELDEGTEVALTLWHEPQTAGGIGEMGITAVMFQLNAAREMEVDELDRAVALAAGADAAVVVVGTTEEVESEGFDRDSLSLPGDQDDLVRRVAAANPNTVVVVNSGAPVLLPWRDEVPTVLLTWFPGQEFGNALADVLLGAAEPGGRLPVAWPVDESSGPVPSTRPVDGVLPYTESIHIGQRGYDRAGVAPAYPFGHGLGYTTWEYLDVSEAGEDVLTVRVRNTGGRAGREVVQVYVSRPDSAVDRPVRWLGGFGAVTADPGAEATVEVVLHRRAFEHWDAASRSWVVEPGEFRLEVGPSAADLRLSTIRR
jgi:beta-glucosidase